MLETIRNVTEAKNIADAFYRIASEHPSKVIYSQAIPVNGDLKEGEPARKYKETTFAECRSKVSKIAKHLQSIGIVGGSKVAILSGTRPEWMEIDLAVLAVGGVTASVYQSLLDDNIAYLLYDSGSEVVFAENQEQVDKLLKIVSKSYPIAATEDREATSAKISLKAIIAIEKVDASPLVTQLDQILEMGEQDAPLTIDSIDIDSLAALVYTSGTTGPPKGVMQTHGNHLANVRQAYSCGMIDSSTSLYLFLPLAHSFAKLVGYLGYLTLSEVKFPAIIDTKSSRLDPASVTKDMRECGANAIPVVPRLLEKMQTKVVAIKNQGGLKAILIGAMLDAATTKYQAEKNGGKVPLGTSLLYALTGGLRKKVEKKLFGDNIDFCLSGGAKLPVSVCEFFRALGVLVIEGYGLTETAVACNVGRRNTPVGSVGPVLTDDIELKIADDGEVMFRGPNVAIGYYNRKTATDQAWDKDGWYHTGDLGALDEKGNLSIVGRKKEIIVTSNGKNIAPHDTEVLIKECPLVSQAVLVGDGRKYCVALVTLAEEEAERWAKQERIPEGTELHEHEQTHARVWAHIEKMNKELASFETVKKVFIVPEDFSVENGLLTPTFKVKRSLIEKLYKEQIDSLY